MSQPRVTQANGLNHDPRVYKKGTEMKRIIFSVMALLLSFGALQTPAHADDDTVTITATVVGSAVAEANGTVESQATGSSHAYAVAQVRSKAKINRANCITTTGINTYYSGGVLHRQYDPVPSKVCALVHPVTIGGYTYHWKKIGGGTTGSNCGNFFVPDKTPPPGVSTIAWLDVRAGAIAKIRVKAKVCVNVRVRVAVRLRYTYDGETKEVERFGTDSDSACKTVSRFAKKRITKQTSKHASAAAVVRVMAQVRAEATAKARAKATAKARAKAVQSVSVVIEIEQDSATASAAAIGCIGPNSPTAEVTASFATSDEDDTTATVSFNGFPPKTVQLTNGQGSASIMVTQTGSYSGTVKFSPSGLTASFSASVEECDTPAPPTGSVTCKNPPHLYAPGGNAIMICELSWSDGHKPTLSEFQIEPLNDYAYFAQPTEFGFREEAEINPCPATTLCVRNQVWAVSSGLFKYRYRIAGGDWVYGQFMIEPDDF